MVLLFALSILLVTCDEVEIKTQNPALSSEKTGMLFIIGGGQLTSELVGGMIEHAPIDSTDYIAVLPMSSAEPDSAYYFFNQSVQEVANLKCAYLNFEEKDFINQPKLDSVRNAKLIFITGGDQNLFMSLVKDSPIHDAIMAAYSAGAMVAGTSAGAAVMSEVMITGDEKFSSEYASTYDKVWKGNGGYDDGLGLLKNAVIDQHFVVRSRYNRLLSALCDHLGMWGIGIDEETAILVKGKHATVIGASQVVVMAAMDSCGVYFNHLKMENVKLSVLTSGDVFELK